MRIVFEDVSARVAAHEELIGRGTNSRQSVAAGQVIVEAGHGIVFALPFQTFKALAPDAVYDPETRRFNVADPLDTWTPEG